jgi:hypothetical protein
VTGWVGVLRWSVEVLFSLFLFLREIGSKAEKEDEGGSIGGLKKRR